MLIQLNLITQTESSCTCLISEYYCQFYNLVRFSTGVEAKFGQDLP